jgi:hypothetical protein
MHQYDDFIYVSKDVYIASGKLTITKLRFVMPTHTSDINLSHYRIKRFTLEARQPKCLPNKILHLKLPECTAAQLEAGIIIKKPKDPSQIWPSSCDFTLCRVQCKIHYLAQTLLPITTTSKFTSSRSHLCRPFYIISREANCHRRFSQPQAG